MNTLASINIGDTIIRQTSANQYCINDLHKAAGALSKDKPSRFLLLDSTKELIAEINKDQKQALEQNQAVRVVNGGNKQGTYVAKELVYAYAMWISPKFHLQVIRTFDALYAQPGPSFLDFHRQLHYLQLEFMRSNPQLQDVLNLARLGYTQARIGEMLKLKPGQVFKLIRRLRGCGFDTAPAISTALVTGE